MRGACDGGIASFLALALLCLFHTSCLVDGLKCYCDICTETNHTCETDGYCFASTSLENDVTTYAKRCYDKVRFFPAPDYSYWCTTNNTLHGPGDMVSVIACCDHSDFCNLNLMPFIPPHEYRGGPYFRLVDYLERGTASARYVYTSKIDRIDARFFSRFDVFVEFLPTCFTLVRKKIFLYNSIRKFI